MAEALADLDEALVRGQREIEKARNQIADDLSWSWKASLDALFAPPILVSPPAPALVPSSRSRRRSGATAGRVINCSTRSWKGMV